MTCGIYKIENIINGNCYVGQSSQIEKRWVFHRWILNHVIMPPKANRHLFSSWKKYGSENFTFTIIEQCDISILKEREQYWANILKNQGVILYNQGEYTDHPTRGIKLSPEARAKISEKAKGRKHSVETRAKLSKINTGKKYSAETRAKVSAASKGRKDSDETRKKKSDAMKNRIITDETRAKIAETKKSKPYICSDETREKISMTSKGRKHTAESRKKIAAAATNISDETRKKRSESAKGKKPSAESRAKMSASAKLRCERKKNKLYDIT